MDYEQNVTKIMCIHKHAYTLHTAKHTVIYLLLTSIARANYNFEKHARILLQVRNDEILIFMVL